MEPIIITGGGGSDGLSATKYLIIELCLEHFLECSEMDIETGLSFWYIRCRDRGIDDCSEVTIIIV